MRINCEGTVWTSRARGRRRKGQALVEFALALPILLLLLAGVLDVSRAYSRSGVIVSAAHQGARYGVSNPTDVTTIKARAIEEAAGSGVTIDQNLITVSTPSGTDSGDSLTVQVTYQFNPFLGRVLNLTTVTIRRDCTMVIF